jgi:hypothetical protein
MGMDLEKYNILNPSLKVELEIYKINKEGGVAYFSLIAKNIADLGVSKTQVHSAINHLTDIGHINSQWVRLEQRWITGFTLNSGEEDFVKILYREIYGAD